MTAARTITVLLGLGVIACGGGMRADVLPVDVAQRRVDRAVSRAVSDAESADAFAATLRFNPARCECPPWELQVGDSWVRAAVRPASADDAPAWLLRDDLPPLTTIEARIQTTRDVESGDNGWQYPVVELEPDDDSATP